MTASTRENFSGVDGNRRRPVNTQVQSFSFRPGSDQSTSLYRCWHGLSGLRSFGCLETTTQYHVSPRTTRPPQGNVATTSLHPACRDPSFENTPRLRSGSDQCPTQGLPDPSCSVTMWSAATSFQTSRLPPATRRRPPQSADCCPSRNGRGNHSR